MNHMKPHNQYNKKIEFEALFTKIGTKINIKYFAQGYGVCCFLSRQSSFCHFLFAAVFENSRHNGLFTLMGSLISFGFDPKCSHTRAVKCGFKKKSICTYSYKLFDWNNALIRKSAYLTKVTGYLHFTWCTVTLCLCGGVA